MCNCHSKFYGTAPNNNVQFLFGYTPLQLYTAFICFYNSKQAIWHHVVNVLFYNNDEYYVLHLYLTSDTLWQTWKILVLSRLNAL